VVVLGGLWLSGTGKTPKGKKPQGRKSPRNTGNSYSCGAAEVQKDFEVEVKVKRE
jgi:hypothetical protein